MHDSADLHISRKFKEYIKNFKFILNLDYFHKIDKLRGLQNIKNTDYFFINISKDRLS